MRNKESLREPDSTQLNDLYNLCSNADNQLKTAVRNLLVIADTLNYKEPYLCIDTTLKSSLIIFRPNSIEKRKSNIIAYPNPARDYFVIDFTDLNLKLDKIANADIYTVGGKMLKSIKINTASGFKVIDIRGWKSGVYSVVVTAKEKIRETVKIIIIK